MESETGSQINQVGLFAQRILDCEVYGPYSKETEHLELFATGKLPEKVPGLTWEKFLEMTPVQTDSLLALVNRVNQKLAIEQSQINKQVNKLNQETNELFKTPMGR